MKLENVFEELSSDGENFGDFTDRLDKALEELPLIRESAEKLMDAITSYDVIELYDALLDTFKEFLTEGEKERIIQHYKDTFNVSELPWWTE